MPPPKAILLSGGSLTAKRATRIVQDQDSDRSVRLSDWVRPTVRKPAEGLSSVFFMFSYDLFLWVYSRILQVVSRFSSARLYFRLSPVSYD
ncbi:hypothetical protein OPV22_033894 [Ensete ventricosum]|uniref:Uncharacterized protein n=1 Tax=Ensete ventricosum TaxID=4639 RepID=A0AAV8Q2Q1_ENSVE|nr:hypothetical protein OPV22_033894 [Ensete ventricosum]